MADQQDTEMGLTSGAVGSHMTGVVRAVVSHTQHLGCERGVQRRRYTIGPVRQISFHPHS
jgi:hypothetical protein